jgi:hypothetical protein
MRLKVSVLSAFGDEVGSGTITLQSDPNSPYAVHNNQLIDQETSYAIPGKMRLPIPVPGREHIAWSVMIEPISDD